MREHLIPSLIASLVASAAAVGVVHYAGPSHVTQVVHAPAGPVSPAKAERIAKTVWPEINQGQVDALTKAVSASTPGKVTIFCIEDAKCSDLALNLENAFESAHWDVTVTNSTMVPPGILSSSEFLVNAIRSTTELPITFDRFNRNAGPGEFIAIGARP